jgi:hypothetical protein
MFASSISNGNELLMLKSKAGGLFENISINLWSLSLISIDTGQGMI